MHQRTVKLLQTCLDSRSERKDLPICQPRPSFVRRLPQGLFAQTPPAPSSSTNSHQHCTHQMRGHTRKKFQNLPSPHQRRRCAWGNGSKSFWEARGRQLRQAMPSCTMLWKLGTRMCRQHQPLPGNSDHFSLAVAAIMDCRSRAALATSSTDPTRTGLDGDLKCWSRRPRRRISLQSPRQRKKATSFKA